MHQFDQKEEKDSFEFDKFEPVDNHPHSTSNHSDLFSNKSKKDSNKIESAKAK